MFTPSNREPKFLDVDTVRRFLNELIAEPDFEQKARLFHRIIETLHLEKTCTLIRSSLWMAKSSNKPCT